jgi:hypothetical protein
MMVLCANLPVDRGPLRILAVKRDPIQMFLAGLEAQESARPSGGDLHALRPVRAALRH